MKSKKKGNHENTKERKYEKSRLIREKLKEPYNASPIDSAMLVPNDSTTQPHNAR
jgi:hypothetical protein